MSNHDAVSDVPRVLNGSFGKSFAAPCLASILVLVLSMGCAGTKTASIEGDADGKAASISDHWYEDGIAIITAAEYEAKVLASDKPVVLEFFTPTCHACRMVAPIYKEMADNYTGKATFLKINAKVNRDLSKSFGIEFTPTFIVFADGKEQARHDGHRFVKPVGEALEKLIP